MCEPISIGIAIGASVGAVGAAATGGDVLQGALIGGVMGGVTGGMGGLGAGSTASTIGRTILQTAPGMTTMIGATGVSTAAATGFAAMGLGSSIAMGMLAPKTPDYSSYTPASQQVAQQQFNSQQIATTGSGGRQASASLAEAIKRSKQRKLSQADVGDLSIDTSAFASTGLQLA